MTEDAGNHGNKDSRRRTVIKSIGTTVGAGLVSTGTTEAKKVDNITNFSLIGVTHNVVLDGEVEWELERYHVDDIAGHYVKDGILYMDQRLPEPIHKTIRGNSHVVYNDGYTPLPVSQQLTQMTDRLVIQRDSQMRATKAIPSPKGFTPLLRGISGKGSSIAVELNDRKIDVGQNQLKRINLGEQQVRVNAFRSTGEKPQPNGDIDPKRLTEQKEFDQVLATINTDLLIRNYGSVKTEKL